VIDMKKAIIDQRETVFYVSGYNAKGDPIMTPLPDSARLAEVADAEFPVAEPLFWVDCPNDAKADIWYYDTAQAICLPVPAAPPAIDQAAVTGAQVL